jgi:hypothetical protein
MSLQRRRAFFFETVKKCEPKVLEDLGQEPMRLYLNAGLDNKKMYGSTRSRLWEMLKSQRWAELIGDPRLFLFRQKLWEWGERWKLNHEWCLVVAFETLVDWTLHPELASELAWAFMIYSGGYVVRPIPGEDRFGFSYRGWHLPFYNRKDYEQAIRESFEAELKNYCDRIEEAAPEHGYIELPSPKHTRKPHLPYEWLVRFRVQGWPINKINKKYYPNSDNRRHIREGINEAASLVGFPPYEFSSG